jgi:GTP cyclohydrolase I
MMLEDVQNQHDDRQFAIDAVGISGIRYPIAVSDRERGKQDTVAEISMSVSLPAEVRGTHLSRFVEIIHDVAGDVTLESISGILARVRQYLATDFAALEFRYPFFALRPAPVTGSPALMEYQSWLSGESGNDGIRLVLAVRVPVTSACPCSKAISDYGAHNQRTYVTIQVSPNYSTDTGPSSVWAEELIDLAELAASCPVFPLLKRPDERYVTMRAYDNPAFVEDIVRDVARALASDGRIAWYSVQALSDESIHNHQAFARIDSSPHHNGLLTPGGQP